MKKKIGLLLLITVFLIPVLINAEGFDFKAFENEYFEADDTLNSNEEVEHSKFIAGNSISSKGSVDGILFSAGNSISIDGENEYLATAGNLINVTGNVEKDAFIAGNQINITGEIGRDLYVAASNIIIKNKVGGNLFVGGETVDLSDATIYGNIMIDSEKLIVNGDTVIKGSIKYNNDTKISGDIKEVVEGSIETYENKSNVNVSAPKGLLVGLKLVDLVTSILGKLVLGLALIGISTKLYKSIISKNEVSELITNAFISLGLLILIPIITIILLCTLIGLRVAFILLFLYIIALIIANTFGSIYFGNIILTKVLNQKDNKFLSLLLGVISISVIGIIPIIGGLVGFINFFVGLGLVYSISKKVLNKIK